MNRRPHSDARHSPPGERTKGNRTADGWRPGRLAIELGIIFAGVFGAFIAEDVRQQREDQQRARQTYEALLGEIQTFGERAPFVVAEMRSTVEDWTERRGRGERPPPPFYREPRAETPATAIWEATLASGGVALLDPALFNDLAVFYNRVISASDRYLRYNDFTEREVLPYVETDAERFYDDGDLKGTYRMHVEFLGEVRAEIEQLVVESGAMEVRIVAELER